MVYSQKDVNLHTHTLFSHHGSGMPLDYVEKAKDAGLKVLGFSEHLPLPYYFPFERMEKNEVGEYVESVRAIKDKKVLVLLGGECDWDKGLYSYYKDEFLSRLGFDYLIGSVHYVKGKGGSLEYAGSKDAKDFDLKSYVDMYCSLLSSHLFLYGCHPDLFVSSFSSWNKDLEAASRDIIACAKENNMPLEINGNGFCKPPVIRDGKEEYLYPKKEFWMMAKDEGIKTVTASDAHMPNRVYGYDKALLFASSLSITFSEYEIDEEKRTVKII